MTARRGARSRRLACHAQQARLATWLAIPALALAACSTPTARAGSTASYSPAPRPASTTNAGPPTSTATASPASPGASPSVGAGMASPTVAATPSPTGPNAAAAPGPKEVNVLGLGDSVTAGSQCGCTPFVQQLAKLLADRDQVPTTATNLGVGGLTSVGLMQMLDDPATRQSVAAADIVVITIGANDLLPALSWWDAGSASPATQRDCGGACDSATLDAVGAQVAGVIARVQWLRGGRPTTVLVTDYWNVFVDGAAGLASRGTGYLAWSGELTDRLNSRICAAAQVQNATCVDLRGPFDGNGTKDPTALLAADGDHPDAAGHTLIADQLLAALPAG